MRMFVHLKQIMYASAVCKGVIRFHCELFDLVSTSYKKIVLIFAPSFTVCATL